MSSNIVSDRLLAPKNLEVNSFGVKGSAVSKDDNFFVDILSKSSKDPSQATTKAEKRTSTTFGAEETSNSQEQDGLEDTKVDSDLTASGNYDCVEDKNMHFDHITFKGCSSDIVGDNNGYLPDSPVQCLDITLRKVQEQKETTEEEVIKDHYSGDGLGDAILPGISLFGKEVVDKESIELIADEYSACIGDNGNIELSPPIPEVSKIGVKQESLKQNLEKQLNKSYTKLGNIEGAQLEDGSSGDQALAGIKREAINFGTQNLVEPILPQETNQPLDQASISVNKTISLNIGASQQYQGEVPFANSILGVKDQAILKVPSDININTKHIESTTDAINFQPIKIQDITRNSIKKDEQILLSQSLEFTAQPLIMQNGDQLLVSYKDTQNQSDVEVAYSEQVVVSVRSAISQGKSQILLSMYPEHLGVVDVKIEFNDLKEISSIKIFAEKPETLQLLQKDSESLLDSLKMVTKSDDASLSFNLRDGQNDQAHYEESKNNNNLSNMEDAVKSIEEEVEGTKSSTNNNADIDITI